jgi:opacity protein-like surface antigen
MSFRLKFFLLFTLIFFTKNLHSQKGFELGGWLGISNYFGDLNTGFNLSRPGLAGGVNYRMLFNDRLAFKSALNYGSVSGNDKYSSNPFETNRNLSFKSNLFDLTNQFEFNFLPYIHGTSTDYFTPYILAGLNIFYYNPTAELDGKKYSLREYGTEGQALGEEYFEFSSGLTVGGGLKWDINHKLSLNLEASYRFIFTDYLDDVSTAYPNIGELRSIRGDEGVKLSDRSGIPGFAVQGKQRGNSRDNDKFSFIGLSLMYYFGQLDCPEINRYNNR